MATPRSRQPPGGPGPSMQSVQMSSSSLVQSSVPSGRVSRLAATWATAGDGQLAARLQQDEVTEHLNQNRCRNEQLRRDVPHARQVQLEEEVDLQSRLQAQHQLQLQDEHLARAVLENDQEYEMMRDQVFMQRILKEAAAAAANRRTPPLPVTSDGDVPVVDNDEDRDREEQGEHQERDQVGGARRRVPKRADEARFWATPIQADNQEDEEDSFYAVGKAYNNNNIASSAKGAASLVVDTKHSLLGLSASEMDAALKAEAAMEAERRDRRLAEQLQEELNVDSQEMEERDRAMALKLHEKNQAKLRRAKERARQKKMQQQREAEEMLQQLPPHSQNDQEEETSDNRVDEQVGSDHVDMAFVPEQEIGSTSNVDHLYARVTQKKKKKNREVSTTTSGEESEEIGEPQYANLMPEAPNRLPVSNEAPPYMPLNQQQNQQLNARRRKKQNNGCTHQ